MMQCNTLVATGLAACESWSDHSNICVLGTSYQMDSLQ